MDPADMHMELVEPFDPSDEHSALAAARLRRKLTREEAAGRAGLSPEQAEWLEDGRLYRFPSGDDAVLASLLYATALGIERREARQMAGLRNRPRPLDWSPASRMAVAFSALVVLVAFGVVLAVPHLGSGKQAAPPQPPAAVLAKTLPPPWKITVDVLNGSGDINVTRQLADRIGALGYEIKRVGKANRFDYPRTTVYFPPGARAIGERLARTLDVEAAPLPGGRDRRHLVVLAGPPHV